MRLVTANTGSYPRIGDEPEKQMLRKTISLWEKGERSDEELRRVENETTRAAIQEQIDAGLELVTDGQVRWYDPLSHIAGKLAGVKIDGLLRFFDTNFYFRQPVVEGDLRWQRQIVVEEFKFARSVSTRPVKPVLTGPYTLAKLSIVNCARYRSLDALVADYAEAIAREVEALVAEGAEIIQIDEPSILKSPEEFDLLAQAMRGLSHRKGRAELALYTYFGDAAPLYARLQDLPVDVIGIDFTYNPALVDLIAGAGSDKALGLGLIDGRNTRIEDADAVCRHLERLLPHIRAEISYLNPSCGLEYLPRDRAFGKLRRITEIKSRFLKCDAI